jgi:tetratricopeptide (TPR) repeat protein
MPGVALDYLRLLALPINLCADYAVNTQRAVSFGNLATLCSLALLSLLAIILLLKRKPAGLFLVWILLCLLPVMQLAPISTLKAERFLYLPSVGYCALIGSIGAWIWGKAGAQRKQTAAAGFLLLIILFSFQTIKRNTVWSEELRLYEKTAECAPDNFRVQYNLGNAYFRAGELERAIAHTQAAHSLKPDFPQAAYNLGVMHEAAGNTKEAELMYREATRLDPGYAVAHNNLAALLFEQGRYEEAELEWLKALALDETLPQPKQGLLLLEQKRSGEDPPS